MESRWQGFCPWCWLPLGTLTLATKGVLNGGYEWWRQHKLVGLNFLSSSFPFLLLYPSPFSPMEWGFIFLSSSSSFIFCTPPLYPMEFHGHRGARAPLQMRSFPWHRFYLPPLASDSTCCRDSLPPCASTTSGAEHPKKRGGGAAGDMWLNNQGSRER